MAGRFSRFIAVWRKITQGFWSAYFIVFNLLYYIVFLSPLIIVSAVLLFVMPERPYMLFLVLGIVAFLFVLFIAVRFLSVRLRFRNRLRRICKKSRFTLAVRRSFFVSFFRASGKCDITVTTPKTVFNLTFIPSHSRFQAIELSADMSAFRRRSRIGFSPLKHVTRRGQVVQGRGAVITPVAIGRMRRINMNAEGMKPKSNLISRKTKNILLFSPVPGEIRLLNEHGGHRTIENGDGVANTAIYSGSGFVNMLDRLSLYPE